MKKILLPVDGSVDCQKALDITENLAKNYDGTITVLYVFDYHKGVNELGYTAGSIEIVGSDASQEMLDQKVEYFEKRGIKANSKLVMGDPASDIIDEAEKGEYDVIIMCTHGMSAGKRFLLGSVTNKVVHHVKVPILIVR